jgi:hypothetical protein
MPLRHKELLFVDLAAHLFILATARGLFQWQTEVLLDYVHTSPQPRLIPVKASIVRQPVLANLTSLKSQRTNRNEETAGEMRTLAFSMYGARLSRDALRVGINGRVTSYSFRRAALTEYMHRNGRIAAQQLAKHELEFNTPDTYVGNFFKFFDFTAARIGQRQRSREELGDMFRPLSCTFSNPTKMSQCSK